MEALPQHRDVVRLAARGGARKPSPGVAIPGLSPTSSTLVSPWRSLGCRASTLVKAVGIEIVAVDERCQRRRWPALRFVQQQRVAEPAELQVGAVILRHALEQLRR